MENCKAPTCQYSDARGKCVRPNAYLEALSWCKRNGIDYAKCRSTYNKKDAQRQACDRYDERLVYVEPKKQKICPEDKVLNPRTNRCNKIKPVKVWRRKKQATPKTVSVDKSDSSISFISSKRPPVPANTIQSSSRSSKSSRTVVLPKSSEYNSVFNRRPIKKSNAVYVVNKQKDKPSIPLSSDDKKVDYLFSHNKPRHIKQRVFMKDIFDDNKKIRKQFSNLEILPAMSSKSPKAISSMSRKIRNIKEKNAANKIKRFIISKIIKKLDTLDDRVQYYKHIKDYLKDTNDKECLESKRFADQNGVVHQGFSIANNLNLVRRIGSDSKYGVVYKTKAKDTLLTLATKLMPIKKDNTNELKVNALVSEIAAYKISKHFLLSYKTYICEHPSNSSAIPQIIKYTQYYLTLNELAHGDLQTLIQKQDVLEESHIIMNLALQCVFGIATFHSCGLTHNDAHYGNFLFQFSNKTTGYYEYDIYGEKYYVKNCGYNMIIYDFGFVKKMTKSSTNYNRMLGDYYRMFHSFQIRPKDKAEEMYGKGWVDVYPPSFLQISRVIKQINNTLNQYKTYANKLSEKQIVENIIEWFINANSLAPNLILKAKPAEEILNEGHPYIITEDIFKYANKARIPLKKLSLA